MSILEEIKELLENGYTVKQIKQLTGWDVECCKWCGNKLVDFEVSKEVRDYDEKKEIKNLHKIKRQDKPRNKEFCMTIEDCAKAIKKYCWGHDCEKCPFNTNTDKLGCKLSDYLPEYWDLDE